MSAPTLEQYFQAAFAGNWLNVLSNEFISQELDFNHQVIDAGIKVSDHIHALAPALDGKPYIYQVPEEMIDGNHAVSIEVVPSKFPGLDSLFPKITVIANDKRIPLDYLWGEFKYDYPGWAAQPLETRKGYEYRALTRRSNAKQEGCDDSARLSAMYKAYTNAYKKAGRASASHPYPVRKKFASLIPRLNIKEFNDFELRKEFAQEDKRRFVSDWGSALFIPLRTLQRNFAGFQRIYDKDRLPSGFGDKHLLEKLHNGQYDAAFFAMGEIVNGQPIAVGEGFATCATIFQHGKEDCVLFAMNSGNVKKLIPELIEHYPDSPIHLYTDNDHKKKKAGNTGIANGYELLKAYKPKLKVFYPSVKKFDPDTARSITDFNDILVEVSEGECRAQLTSQRNRMEPAKSAFEHSLNMLSIMARSRGVERQVLQVLRLGLSEVPLKAQASDVVRLVKSRIERAGLAVDLDLIAEADRIMGAKRYHAMKSRSFSKDDRKAATSYKRFRQTKVDSDIVDHVSKLSGIVVVRAGMASRKTSMLIKSMMGGAGHYAYLAHRISLIGGAVSELNYRPTEGELRQGFVPNASVLHYRDDAGCAKFGGIDKLGCCINSITKPVFSSLFDSLDGLFIDEGSQMLRGLMNGVVDKPKLVEDRLAASINRCTGPVVVCDADADSELVRYLMQRFPDKALNLVELDIDCSDLSVNFGDANAVYSYILDDIKAGKKVVVATDNAKLGQQLQDEVNSLYKTKRTLLISQENSGEKDVQEFQHDPNAFLRQGRKAAVHGKGNQQRNLDLLIYSPSISSGVSITTKHFDKTYGIFKGVVTPSDAVQMLRRNRMASTFTVGLTGQKGYRETSHDAILKGHLVADGLAEQASIDWERRMIMSSRFTLFDETRCRLQAIDNDQRNDFANNMLLQMDADGWNLTRMAVDDDAEQIGKESRKLRSELIKEKDWLAIEAATTPDQSKAKLLENKKAAAGLSVEEKRELDRYMIENGLQEPVTRETYNEYCAGALGQLKRMELVTMPKEQALAVDKAERAAGIPKTLRQQAYTAQQFYKQCFLMAGVDPSTGEGKVLPENLAAWYKWLHTPDVMPLTTRFSVGKRLGEHTAGGCPTSLFKLFLARFGLVMDKEKRETVAGERKTVRRIDQDRITTLLQRLQKRKVRGLTFYDPTRIGGATLNEAGFSSECIPSDKSMATSWDEAINRVISNLKQTREWFMPVSYTYLRSRFTQAEAKLYEAGRLSNFDIAAKLHQLINPVI